MSCPSGLLTGCSLASGGGLGSRFEDGDDNGAYECVGYSDGERAVSVQAACTARPAAAEHVLAFPVRATTRLDQIENLRTWTAVGCPPPFGLAGCSCFSEGGTCKGAAIAEASDGSGRSVCNVSHVVPRTYWRSGAEAHGACMCTCART